MFFTLSSTFFIINQEISLQKQHWLKHTILINQINKSLKLLNIFSIDIMNIVRKSVRFDNKYAVSGNRLGN